MHVPARTGTDPTAGMAAYSLSKEALSYLVHILDLELRPARHPGQHRHAQLLHTAANRALFPTEPLANATQPEAVANVISFSR